MLATAIGVLLLPAAESQSAPSSNNRTSPVIQHPLCESPVVDEITEPCTSRLAIRFDAGLLTIIANKSTLREIVSGIQARTGMMIEYPRGLAEEDVVVNLGPGPLVKVLSSLFTGSALNYIILGSDEHPQTVRVVLTKSAPLKSLGPRDAENSLRQDVAPQPEKGAQADSEPPYSNNRRLSVTDQEQTSMVPDVFALSEDLRVRQDTRSPNVRTSKEGPPVHPRPKQ